MPTLYLPDFLYTESGVVAGVGLLVGDDGTILQVGHDIAEANVTKLRLRGKALLPGLVNGHSHSFQRVIRGAAEHGGPNGDDFWAWRNVMYAAAARLSPEDQFDVARMAFLEMALSGITSVGEFHYVHRQPDGSSYDDPNLLAKYIIRAAKSVGLRICLLRVAYIRAGFDLPPNPGQIRFYENCDEYLRNVSQLAKDVEAEGPTVSMGVAPHSIRAVPLEALRRVCQWAGEHSLPIHIHAAEQHAEIVACEKEHGVPPISLLAREGLLSDKMTLVHAIHTSPAEVDAIAHAGATICSCPTTERNLGDGIIDADLAITRGVGFSFGSDSQSTINLLEDARELDYHLRLKRQRRVLLDGIDKQDMATRLFRYATAGGARSLNQPTGVLEAGRPADFFSVNLHDVAIAGAAPKELLSMIVFSLERAAVQDVVVNGSMVVRDGQHRESAEIISRYEKAVQQVGLNDSAIGKTAASRNLSQKPRSGL